MPFKSQAQRAFMYAQHPRIAKRFEKETPKGKKLPKKLKTINNKRRQALNTRVSKMKLNM